MMGATTLEGEGHLGPAAMATATGQRQAVSAPQKGLPGQPCGQLRQAHAAHQSHGSRQPSLRGVVVSTKISQKNVGP